MICDTIKSLRESVGVSQATLAKRIGVTRSAVNAWEMGFSVPTAQYIVELSQFFHVSADYILGLKNREAFFVDSLSEKEKKIIFDLYEYFISKE